MDSQIHTMDWLSESGGHMKKANIITAIAFACFGLLIILLSLNLDQGKNGVPGPGFWPIVISALMIMASLTVLINSIRMKEGSETAGLFSSPGQIRVYASMGSLVAYFILVQLLGFCFTTGIMLFGLFKWFWKRSYVKCAILSIFVTAIVYLVFTKGLHVPMRYGILF